MRQAYVTGRINQVAAGSEPDPRSVGPARASLPRGGGPPTRVLAAWMEVHVRVEPGGQGECASRLPRGLGGAGGWPPPASPPTASCFGRLGQTGLLNLATECVGAGGGGSVEPHVPPAWWRTRWGGEVGPAALGGRGASPGGSRTPIGRIVASGIGFDMSERVWVA